MFFRVDAEPVVVEEARSEEPDEEATTLLVESDRALFTARVDPRTAAKVGGRITLTVDPARLYYFSPQTGESLLGRERVAA